MSNAPTPQPSPSLGGGLATLIWGIWLGMGLTLGYGLIRIIAGFISAAAGRDISLFH